MTLVWIAVAGLVGYVVGREVTLWKWNAERRRMRKRLGIANLEDHLHRD